MKRRSLIVAGLMASVLALTACGDDSKSKSSTKSTAATETPVVTKPADISMGTDLSFDGYDMVWNDEFEADKLNRNDWNVELHDPGWVNNELQSYVDSEENIYLEDGKLVIKPVQNGSEYTSGRVNTQGKKDFTYGIFEAKIKMPAGKGFLPAFWLMSTDENVYGQWPRCGEIDIAEVLGHDTKKNYGTIHYGNPHKQNQGTYLLKNGDFSSEFHDFAVEWLPGEIKWYVDGNLMYSTTDWYSRTENIGEITYPAPFDQPFYVILNLAVGGVWPGNPDATTDIANASMEIDYVRVFQKESYEVDVEKPEEEVVLRDPDSEGNYVVNSNFEDESLSDNEAWKFMTNEGGKGEANIENNHIHITTEEAGTVDYSIQLVQPDIPMFKGASYEFSFKAYASENRKMTVAITAPEAGWVRYYPDTVYELTTEEQEFVISVNMSAATDAKARIEFNMGNTSSTADIYITDVKLKMIGEPGESTSTSTVLGDGNYVYNSKFQEGPRHLGSWKYEGEATYEVTPWEDGRKLKLVVPTGKTFTVSQKGLGIIADSDFVLTFDAASENSSEVKVTVNNTTTSYALTKGMANYKYSFSAVEKEHFNDLAFTFGEGTYYLDNVRIVEDVLVKNGSFSAGLSGYEVYVDSGANAKYVVDSISEESALDVTVENTGDADWKVQVKQTGVNLENGKKYKLTFDAKSSMPRKIRALLQGEEARGWVEYSTDTVFELSEEYKTFTSEFVMAEASDEKAFLSICLGAVEEVQINESHRVVIDNISLVEIE